MTTTHTTSFVSQFSFLISADLNPGNRRQNTVNSRWKNLSKQNAIHAVISYIPLINLIIYALVLKGMQKDTRGQYLKTSPGKAFLGRSIMLMTGFLIPVVMILDGIGTIMKCHQVAKNKLQSRKTTEAVRWNYQDLFDFPKKSFKKN